MKMRMMTQKKTKKRMTMKKMTIPTRCLCQLWYLCLLLWPLTTRACKFSLATRTRRLRSRWVAPKLISQSASLLRKRDDKRLYIFDGSAGNYKEDFIRGSGQQDPFKGGAAFASVYFQTVVCLQEIEEGDEDEID